MGTSGRFVDDTATAAAADEDDVAVGGDRHNDN
jgi:hypothetical protein